MVGAAIYVRQSLDRTGDEAAVLRQQTECEALCRDRGYQIVEVYTDNDISASNNKPRPAYQRLLRDAAEGRFQVLVAWHPDRLHRRPRELEDFISIIEANHVSVLTVRVGLWDLSTPGGRLMARQLGAVARYEVEHKAERQRAGNRQRAMAGVPHASPRPFGYRAVLLRDQMGRINSRTLEVDSLEAEALRTAYGRLLAGASLRGIAAEWNAAGFVTSRGRAWSPYSVRDRLKHPMYAGIVTYNGEEVGHGNWQPVVKEEIWRAARTILEHPSRRTTPGNTRKYMLSGLAICGVEGCGAKVATGRTQHGRRTYQCSASKHLSRAAEPIDDLVTRIVVARLSQPDAVELLREETSENYDVLRDQAQALRARELEAADAYAAVDISLPAFQRIADHLQDNLKALERRIQVSANVEVLREVVDKDAAAVWDGLRVDRRRAVVDALMTITLLQPGRGKRTFDPCTVQLTWRRPV